MRRFWHIQGYLQRPLVRPWALSAPVLVLMLCLPMLRPLLRPDPSGWSAHEQLTAATVQALVEHHTLAIDQSVFRDNPAAVHRDGHIYSPHSPMLPLLLAPWYWLLMRNGMTYGDDLIFAQYLLTLIGAAVPAAICSGLVYRLGRTFELRRSLRVGLGLVSVIGGGLLTCGVVINPQAPAAMFLLVAISIISYLTVTGHPRRNIVLTLFAGGSAATAACLDPAAAMLAILIPIILMAMRWNGSLRTGGICLYILGAAVPVAANMAMIRMVGDLPAEPSASAQTMAQLNLPSVPVASVVHAPSPDEGDEDLESAPGRVEVLWSRVASWIGRCLEGLVGEHGILSHYPITVLGLLGAIRVLHRNWTPATKAFAGMTLLACLLSVIMFAFVGPRPMAYGVPWFVTLSPVLLFWTGAWLKRGHRSQSWVMAGIILLFSCVVTFVGMLSPAPARGYGGYSFGQAVVELFRP